MVNMILYVLRVYQIKVKVKSSSCYSASYMRRTEDQKRFTILEVAADWHELMIPQRTMRPSTACVSEQ